jgi:hypothetical protein
MFLADFDLYHKQLGILDFRHKLNALFENKCLVKAERPYSLPRSRLQILFKLRQNAIVQMHANIRP